MKPVRVILSGLLLLMLIGSLSVSAAEVELEIAVWGEPSHFAMYREILDLFEEQYPQYKVVLHQWSWDEYTTKIVTMAAGGVLPDVFMVHDFRDFHSKGFLENLDPYIAKDPTFDLSGYFPKGLEQYAVEGKQYGLLIHASVHAIVYNADIVAEAGLVMPNDLLDQNRWNWDGFVEWGKKLVQFDAAGIQTRFAFKPTDLFPYIAANGANFFDEFGEVALDSPEFIEAIEWVANLTIEHRVAPPASAWDVGWPSILSGQLVSIPTWPLIQDINNLLPGVTWDVVPYPKGKQWATVGGGPAFVMSSTSTNKEAAWELLKFMVGHEANVIYAENSYGIPGLAQVAFEYWATGAGLPKHASVWVTVLDHLVQEAYHPKLNEIMPYVNAAFWDAITGQRDARSAMLEAARQARNIINQ